MPSSMISSKDLQQKQPQPQQPQSKNDNNNTLNDNSNGNQHHHHQQYPMDSMTDSNPTQPAAGSNAASIDECLDLFKACCKKKTDFGLEDIFWILFLLIIIIFSILKGLTRYTWSQITYMMFGSILILIILYVAATIFNKFVLEDSSTAHWNAHARYTQAAIHCRLGDEEQRVHVIAPPKMGGAKLNIIYSVGDVPLSKTASSGSSSTINGAGQTNSRHGSISSVGAVAASAAGGGFQQPNANAPNALTNLTQQAINTAAALLGATPIPSTTALTPNIVTSSSTCATTSSNMTIKSHHHHHQVPSKSSPPQPPPSSSSSTQPSATSSSSSGSILHHHHHHPIISLKDEIIAEEDDQRPETPNTTNNNNSNSNE